MSQSCKNIESGIYCKSSLSVTYVHDLDGNLTFLNQQGQQLLGYSCEEVRRLNINEIVAPDIAPQVRDQILHTTNGAIGMVYEIEVMAKDGHRVPLEISTRVVFRRGQAVEIEGVGVPRFAETSDSRLSGRHTLRVLQNWNAQATSPN